MEVEREAMMEAAAAVVGVGLFVIGLLLIGAQYTDQGLASEGAFALVGALVGFILVMSAIGYLLAGRET